MVILFLLHLNRDALSGRRKNAPHSNAILHDGRELSMSYEIKQALKDAAAKLDRIRGCL
jgi:hypothetical protein